jgi:RNA polymerase sigma-70 factor (family 1)
MGRKPGNMDTDLIRAMRAGERDAFEKIYDETAPGLLQHIHLRIRDKAASEELVQDIFLSLWSRREDLDPQTNLKSYLYGAAKFQVLNFIRSEKTHRKYIEHLALFAAQIDQPAPDQSIYAEELKVLLRQHMEQLPAKCRHAFYLSRFAQKSISEIAEEMGISTRTVENYLTRALKHLREMLTKYAWLMILAGIFVNR